VARSRPGSAQPSLLADGSACWSALGRSRLFCVSTFAEPLAAAQRNWSTSTLYGFLKSFGQFALSAYSLCRLSAMGVAAGKLTQKFLPSGRQLLAGVQELAASFRSLMEERKPRALRPPTSSPPPVLTAKVREGVAEPQFRRMAQIPAGEPRPRVFPWRSHGLGALCGLPARRFALTTCPPRWQEREHRGPIEQQRNQPVFSSSTPQDGAQESTLRSPDLVKIQGLFADTNS
jgi:hypothetical protein